jgi:acetoacetyl-CoA synthetase
VYQEIFLMAKQLWAPSEDRIRNTNIYRFMETVNTKYTVGLTDYNQLYQWSIDHIGDFWETMWTFAGIVASAPFERVADDLTRMPGTQWFPGARLNFAENLLRYRDEQAAVIFKGENLDPVSISYAELYKEVARVGDSV